MSWLARHQVARMADPADGTLKVTASTYPPSDVSAMYASVRVTGVVQAPGLPATAVEHSGTAPVAKWPQPGTELPVTVDRARPGQLVIHWDQVPSARATALVAAEAEAAELRTGLDPAVLADAIGQTTPGHAPAWSAALATQLPPPAPGHAEPGAAAPEHTEPEASEPEASELQDAEPDGAGPQAAGTDPACAGTGGGGARPTLPPSTATEPVTGRVVAVRDVQVPAAFAPPGGIADLTVTVPGPSGREQTVTCRAAFPTLAQRAQIAVVGATPQFLIDPADPTIITLPA